MMGESDIVVRYKSADYILLAEQGKYNFLQIDSFINHSVDCVRHTRAFSNVGHEADPNLYIKGNLMG